MPSTGAGLRRRFLEGKILLTNIVSQGFAVQRPPREGYVKRHKETKC